MTQLKPTTRPQATGYFKAKRNDQEFFNSEMVFASRTGKWIVIEAHVNPGFPDGMSFELDIDEATPGGEQNFVREGYLRSVKYYSGSMMQSAYAGTFTATLNNATKRYQLTFKLNFYSPDNLVIEGELDITG